VTIQLSLMPWQGLLAADAMWKGIGQ